MKVNTALGFFLCGLSLWLWCSGELIPWRRRGAQVCAAGVVLIGALTLGEYLLGWNLGIDQLLFQEAAGAVATSHAGRMSFHSALAFVCVGLALWLLGVEARRGIRPSELLTLAGGSIGWLAFLGYIYGIEPFYGLGSSTPVAIHTAFTFMMVSLGILCFRPDRGGMAVIVSDSSGGWVARRLLPLVILVPMGLGWLRLVGQRAGLYGTELGITLVVAASTLFFGVVIFVMARLLHETDTKRKQMEETLRAAGEALKEKVGELELLNKVMMGREERILKLKEEIERLKKQPDKI